MADIGQEEIAPDDGFSEVEGPFLDSAEQGTEQKYEVGEPGVTCNQDESEGENKDHGDDDFGHYKVHVEEEDEEEEDQEQEQLMSLVRLRYHAESDVTSNRLLAVRNLLNVLSRVTTETELHSVVSAVCQLSEDGEENVRTELVDRIPEIATYCRSHGSNLDFLIRQQLVPITVKLSEDSQFNVRSAARMSLVELIDRNLINSVLLNEWICPLIAHQAVSLGKSEERRIEALVLMCLVAEVVGKELTVNFFLKAFNSLMSDSSLSIRKNCIAKLASFCRVIGSEHTEEVLLPKFLRMCQGDQWGVRKVCAEVFVDVTMMVASSNKKSLLTDVFLYMLCDESRWVRFAAYQSLGRFIVTFADPSKTGLKYNDDGTWTLLSSEGGNCLSAHTDLLCDSDDCANENLVTDKSFSPKRTASMTGGDAELLNDISVYYAQKSLLEKLESRSIENKSPASSFQCNSTDVGSRDLPVSSPSYSLVDNSKVTFVSDDLKSIAARALRQDTPLSVIAKGGHLHVHLDNESVFNNFQFWRLPLPEVELDVDIENGHATSIHVRTKTRDERTNQICSSDFRVDISSLVKQEEPLKVSLGSDMSKEPEDSNDADSIRPVAAEVTEMLIRSASVSTVHTTSPASECEQQESSVIQSSFDEARVTVMDGELKELKQSHNDLCSPDQTLGYDRFEISHMRSASVSSDSPLLPSGATEYPGVKEQDIVPPGLLRKYIEMGEPSLTHAIDSEVTLHCAYSLPAVAYTLGRKNWVCLSRLCEVLASDMQWKVRRTIAASLHVLAAILGSDIAGNELLQLFFSLINDLDEVRASIIQNLSEFLKHLHYKSRKKFLPQLKKFLKMDNEHNWRFRHTFVKQLIPLTRLYYHSDVEDYIYPVAMFLIRDRVCEVRLETMRLIAVIMLKLSSNETTVKSVIKDLKDKFGSSPKWLWRQTFILICQQFAIERSLPASVFSEDIAAVLLGLGYDAVPNVRLALARCLSETLPLDYLNEIERRHGQKLSEVISVLQVDVDRDVRSFASMSLITNASMQDMLSPV